MFLSTCFNFVSSTCGIQILLPFILFYLFLCCIIWCHTFLNQFWRLMCYSIGQHLCAEVWSSLEWASYLILDPCFDFLCEFQSNAWVSKIIVVICLINALLQSGPVFISILWWHCTANHLQRYLACLPIDQLWTCRNLLNLYISRLPAWTMCRNMVIFQMFFLKFWKFLIMKRAIWAKILLQTCLKINHVCTFKFKSAGYET